MTATKLDLVKVEDWGLFTDTTKPIIIAGPCSAESEQQVFETAKGLKAAGVEVLRAGIWKPRTRPNCFEGVGSEGLVWMKRVQRELGMKISTEVANVKHVYEALKAGVDMLWIGARTSANPFAMKELADALKGKLCFEKNTFPSLEMAKYLEGKDFDTIELCGLVSNICVLSNAVMAKSACPNSEIIVDSSLTAAADEEMHQKSLDVMKGLFIKVL